MGPIKGRNFFVTNTKLKFKIRALAVLDVTLLIWNTIYICYFAVTPYALYNHFKIGCFVQENNYQGNPNSKGFVD